MMEMSRHDFELLIAEALDRLPADFAQLMSNITVQVRDTPSLDTLRDLGLDPHRHTLFGLYTGVPLQHRGGSYGNVLPDVILLYRRPLLNACTRRGELIRQVQLTLLHEIGHHFGFSDAQMEAWEEEFSGLD